MKHRFDSGVKQCGQDRTTLGIKLAEEVGHTVGVDPVTKEGLSALLLKMTDATVISEGPHSVLDELRKLISGHRLCSLQ